MSHFFRTARNVLGMNARNLTFIRPHNSRSAVKLARNKLETKECLLATGLPSAQLYATIHNRKELFEFDWNSLPASMVLKPNFGLGGNGIKVFYGKTKSGRWISASDQTYSSEDLALHVSNILDGDYSIANIPDIAYFEERLQLSEEFKRISYKGIPDIRVIVFNSVPIMAMLRLPTKESDGKANLQMGGIGVGVDLSTGRTTFATSKYLGELSTHPDYNTSLRDVQIPYWGKILRISIAAQQAVGLGYAGVDIVIDKQLGPVILEVNGHPGLEIQNANHATLRDRLERVSGLNITGIEKGVQVCKELFSDDQYTAPTKPVLGVFEAVSVVDCSGKIQALRARLDTGLLSTTITRELAKRLGFTAALEALDTIVFPSVVSASDAQQVEDSFRQSIKGLNADIIDIVAVRSGAGYTIRPKIALTITLAGHQIQSHVAIAMDNKLSHPMIIGRRDLKDFLIDAAKTK